MMNLIELIELAENSKVKSLKKLGADARREFLQIMEHDELDEEESSIRAVKAMEDYIMKDEDYPRSHVTGAFVIAEAVQPNGDTRLTTRQWGVMNLPHTRVGALQQVTSAQMNNYL